VSTADHTAKYGATITINCQVKDGTGAAPGNVALAARKITMTVSREFNLDSVGTQDGNIVLATSTVALTDATGAASFTVAGPADPSTGTDDHIDTIVLTSVDAMNCGVATTGKPGFMTEGGGNTTCTHTQTYVDTTAAASKTVLTSSASTGLISAVAGITRLVTATVYDQYGDTVAGNTVTFTAAQALPSGGVCPAVAVTICTTLAPHGLATGDKLMVADDTDYHSIASTGVLASGDSALAALDLVCVGAVGSTTTFNLMGLEVNSTTDHGCASAYDTNGHVASTAAAPLFVVHVNPDGFTAAVTRVTSSAGSASYSWSDKHAVSGGFITTAIGAGASAATHTFFRLDAGADFTEVGAGNDATLTNGDTLAKLVEWDGTNNDFTILKAVAAAATHALVTYQQYSFDANDHFAFDATVTAGSGTATTMATFETKMAGNVAAAPAYGAIALAQYVALSTGIAKFSEG
jgi:hypothetical protein